jgi:hypothetical protein
MQVVCWAMDVAPMRKTINSHNILVRLYEIAIAKQEIV